jgi:surface polysaccharide O-acyltransferase-like enzyme
MQRVDRAATVARTLACASVVMVHINLHTRPGVAAFWPLGFLTAPIYGLSVPLFFMLSGFFAGRFASGVKRPGILHILRKKLKVLIVPFLAWSVILLALLAKTVPAVPVTTGWAIYQLLTGVWQLYYVFVLIQLLLIYYLIEPSLTGKRLDQFLGICAAVSVAFYAFAGYVLHTRGPASEYIEADLIKTPLPWIVFFVLGLWLRSRTKVLAWLAAHIHLLSLATLAAHLLYWRELIWEDDKLGYNPILQFLALGFPYRILAPLLCLVILIRLQNLNSSWLRPVLEWLSSQSRYTYAIYLCHTAFLMIFLTAVRGSGRWLASWFAAPAFFVAVWLASMALIWLLGSPALRPIGRLLFGTVPGGKRIHRVLPRLVGVSADE